jgi:CRP/FNR family cyclic AMP-dependent transcriptional regulator
MMKRFKFKKHFLDDHSLGTTYPDGHVFFNEGELCDALYIVQVGNVRIFTTLDSGHEIELALVEPGEIFGITSLFAERPRIATAATFGDSSVLRIERAKLLDAIHDDPTLVFYILKSMSIRSRRLKDRLAISESKHIKREMECD